MDDFAKSNSDERREGFVQAAAARQMTPLIVEKDFWVCWTLKALFELQPLGDHLIFKGGTSLSKAFRVIERFSEDIDISIDRGFLGFSGANEPEAGGSNKEKQRRIAALKTACQEKIAGNLLPALGSAIRSKLPPDEGWSLQPDAEDPDQQTLLFQYPSSFEPDQPGYVRRMVKIELGARADHWPSESRTITPYVADAFPAVFKRSGCAVKVLSVERTFWEKATILHAEFHRPPGKAMPDRLSRHYSDFHEMIRRGVASESASQLDLLARVAEHKSLFFRSGWARYDEAAKGSLRLAPPEHRLKELRQDYARMEQMFFGEAAPFDAMISRLADWEAEFNRR